MQARDLSSMHAPMFGLRACLYFFGQGSITVFFLLCATLSKFPYSKFFNNPIKNPWRSENQSSGILWVNSIVSCNHATCVKIALRKKPCEKVSLDLALTMHPPPPKKKKSPHDTWHIDIVSTKLVAPPPPPDISRAKNVEILRMDPVEEFLDRVLL